MGLTVKDFSLESIGVVVKDDDFKSSRKNGDGIIVSAKDMTNIVCLCADEE